MTDWIDPEAVFLAHLEWIDRVASIACSKNGVWGAEAEDFKGWVQMQLMEDDYAVLRNFKGDSEIKTYLASVVTRQFITYLRKQGGRWRPSAAAERLGSPARELEILVRREHYTLEQAGQKLRTSGLTTLSDIELARLLARLPERPPLRPVQVDPELVLGAKANASHADERVTAAEAEARRNEMMGALGQALGQLEPEEQVIVKMHFADGYTLADVARALGLEQKPLYRRVDRLRARLKAFLESAGLRGDDVRGLLYEMEAP
ncbi:MAG: sigma-70 family RNA polymerase sigma factor [Longimicrobiaceae bacterium]